MATSRRSFITKAAVAAAMTPLASLSTFGQGYEQAIDKTPRRSAPADLKITDIKCGYIRGSVMVKIYTNQDIWGCGEGVDAIPGTYHLVKNFGNRLKGKDPLNAILKTITDNNIATEEEIKQINERVEKAVAESVKFAEESPWPNDDEVLKDVYVDQNYPFITD